MQNKDFDGLAKMQIIACLSCEIVWVSTMPRGKIASCRDDGGGHKPLNSAALMNRVCPVNPSARDQELWGLLTTEPALRSPEQGADLWQSDQVDTNLCSANTEVGLLLQSERQIIYCVRRHDHSLERKNVRTAPRASSSISNF